MGTWNISIRGIGQHHNAGNAHRPELYKADADHLAKEFVKQLISSGHSIVSCEITYGGADSLLPVGEPIGGTTTPDPKPIV